MGALMNPGSREGELTVPLASFVSIGYFITADQDPV
jgi:hypothetical protein